MNSKIFTRSCKSARSSVPLKVHSLSLPRICSIEDCCLVKGQIYSDSSHPAVDQMRLQRLPAMFIIVLLHFGALVETPLRHTDHETRFKHEGHVALSYFGGLEFSTAGSFKRRSIRSVCGHDIVKGSAGERGYGSLEVAGICETV